MGDEDIVWDNAPQDSDIQWDDAPPAQDARVGRLGITPVQGNVESPNFGRAAIQALASGPASFGREVAPSANYYGNEVPSGAFRGMVNAAPQVSPQQAMGMYKDPRQLIQMMQKLVSGYQRGAMRPEQQTMLQPQMIDSANRTMDSMGVNKLPNQNIMPKWTGQNFNPQVAARFMGGLAPSAFGMAADMGSRPADTIAMMASGLPAGESLVGASRSMPALEGYGEMMNIAPQVQKMNVGDRLMQMMPFLQQRFGGKGNNVEQMVSNNRRSVPLADEAYKTVSEVIPVNEKIGGYEQKVTGQKYPEATRTAAGEVVPSKDYSQLTQQMQAKNKMLWKNIVQRLTGKANLNKTRFLHDVKASLGKFRQREMGRAGYSDSDNRMIAEILERFFEGLLEQEKKTGKYDMLDALMDKRVENELTARLRKMEGTGQNLGSISAEKIAHEAIREALLKQVTEADPVAGQMARKWGQIDEATTKTAELSQREANTVRGGIDPASVIANPKGSVIKAVTDKVLHRDLQSKTTKIANNMKKIQQLQAETKALMQESFKSSPAYNGPKGGGQGDLEGMPPFTHRPSPEKPNWTRVAPEDARRKAPDALPQQAGVKMLEHSVEGRPAPKQLEYQNYSRLTGKEAETARNKSFGPKTMIGERTIENQKILDEQLAARRAFKSKKGRSVGAAATSSLDENPAVMAPPQASEGMAPRSTTRTEVMREVAPENEKILQDIDWGTMKSRNPLIERLQEFKDDGTPLGKHLNEQAKYLIKSIYQGEQEAGATAREFIQSNAGVLDQKAGTHMSRGVAARSSEAPLSESKTIREGNPSVTDVGEKSVGAMQVKNAPKGIVIDKKDPTQSKYDDGKFVGKFTATPDGKLYFAERGDIHVSGMGGMKQTVKNGKTHYDGHDFDHLIRVIQSEDGDVVYMRASSTPEIDKLMKGDNYSPINKERIDPDKIYAQMAEAQKAKAKELFGNRPDLKVIVASGRDFGGIDLPKEVNTALFEKVDPKFKMVMGDEKWGYRGKYVRAGEGGAQSPATVRNTLETHDLLPEISGWKAASQAGAIKKGWDKRASESLKAMFGKDAPLVADLVAATSPVAPVEENYKMALTIFKKWKDAGRPTDEAALRELIGSTAGVSPKMAGRFNNALRAFKGEKLSGTKVENWSRALKGDPEAITNDVWVARFAGLPESLSESDHLALNIAIRQTAKQLGWSPAEAQETMWSFTKHLWDSGLIKDPDVAFEKITGEALRNVPEYATLLKNPKIRSIVEGIGVSEKDINKAISIAEEGLAESAKFAKEQKIDEVALRKELRRLHALYEFNEKVKKLPKLKFRKAEPQQITQQLAESTRKEFLTQYKPTDYKGAKVYMADGKKVGYAIKKDGDLVSVFNNSGEKNLGMSAVLDAVENGATKLDCVGDHLKAYYERFGFREYKSEPWNDKFAPSGWDYKKNGKPNIYYMKRTKMK